MAGETRIRVMDKTDVDTIDAERYRKLRRIMVEYGASDAAIAIAKFEFVRSNDEFDKAADDIFE